MYKTMHEKCQWVYLSMNTFDLQYVIIAFYFFVRKTKENSHLK